MRAATITLVLCLFTAHAAAQLSTRENSASGPQQSVTLKEITPAQLEKMLGSANLFVYDCNEPDMHAEAHVPGTIPTVYDEVRAENLPADHKAKLVFYCYSPECPAAATAAQTAIELGYADVSVMPAGIVGWQDTGLKTEP